MRFLDIFFDDIDSKLESDESIVMQDSANLLRKAISVGGKLTLTNNRLIFQPHKINFDRSDETIDLETIKGVKKVKTFDIFDTSLRITTDEEDEFKFILNADTRDKWFDKLDSLIKS